MNAVNFFRPCGWLGVALGLFLSVASHSSAQSTTPGLSVSLIAPTNGDTFSAPPNSIQITAATSDYGAYVHTIAFYAGSNQLAFLILDPIGPSETNGLVINVDYTWTDVAPGNYSLIAVVGDTAGQTATSAPVNITVSDSSPVPTVSIVATTPGATLLSPGVFTVSRSGNTNIPVNVFYSIGGLSSNGVVYASLPDPLFIPAGATSAQITVTPLKNPPFGAYETVDLQLTGSPGASPTTYIIANPSNATVRIFPVVTRPPPVVTIFATDPIAMEGTNFGRFQPVTSPTFTNYYSGTNTATFLVRRVGPTAVAPTNDLVVYYNIGGTASNGVDYVKLPGNVTIPAGKNYALITINPLEDIDPTSQPFSTVILSLYVPLEPLPQPQPYSLGWPAKAGAIILEESPFPGSPPFIPPIAVLPDSSFHINFPGTNGQNYCVQVSSDLINWLPVCTNPVVKGGIEFIDPEAATLASRFYRAAYVPALPQY